MRDYPFPASAGVLCFWFLEKLCERLEADNKLPAGEAKRIWAAIVADLQPNKGTQLPDGCLAEIARLKLA